MFKRVQRFSIRKLTIGAASVLIGIAFLGIDTNSVHADSTPVATVEAAKNKQSVNSDASAQLDKANTADSSKQSVQNNKPENSNDTKTDNKTDANALKSDIKNNATGTSKSSAPVSAGQKPADKQTEQNKPTDHAQNKANDNKSASNELVIDKSGKNQTDSEKNNELVNASKDEKSLVDDSKIQLKKAKADAPASDPDPVPIHYLIGIDDIYLGVGTDITNSPARVLKNGQELLAAGAKLSWVGSVPTFTQAEATTGAEKHGTVRVTYKDGTHKDITMSFLGEPQAVLNPKQFYYVEHVGDKVDFTKTDVNGNNFDTILSTGQVADPGQLTYDVEPVDTSEIGIHWATVKITDHYTPDGISYIVADPYYVKIPYIVEGLKIRDDIPKDSAGNPIINAQLATEPQGTSSVPTTPISAFNPSASNTALLGQYFYQDYALAYALGITTSITGWTAPTDLANTKTNSFKLITNYNPGSGPVKLRDSKEQTIDVHYVSAPQVDNIYFYNPDRQTYVVARTANKTTVEQLVNGDSLKERVWVTLADGRKVYATKLQFLSQLFKSVNGISSGQFTVGFNATFGGTNSAGQPLIFNNSDLDNVAGAGFNDAVNHWYQLTNNTLDTANFAALGNNTWDRISTTAVALVHTVSADKSKLTADVTDGPITYTNSDTGNTLSAFVENPPTVDDLNKYLDNNGAGWDWYPKDSKLNSILNGNTTWPEGTKFEWAGDDGSKTLSFDKAGEIKTGSIKVSLPSGADVTVKNITVESQANVKAKSESIDYGTILTAADLVTNKDVFPEGTVFKFANNSEPTWIKSGSYSNVQITATYKDANGNIITTAAASCAVAINSTRSITVLEGSSVPTTDSVLNFPDGWESNTSTWSTNIDTNGSNQGEINVHYDAHNLDQKIFVFVTVIPKTKAIDGEQFFTNGNKYDKTPGSIANGTKNQGSILTEAGNNPISYQAYYGNPGDPTSFKQKATSYSPSFSLSGLQINADGSLVSGVQNVTVRVSVPKGTIGANHDKDGNYYYDLSTTIEVAQPVTFEFVDDANNETVGTPQTQEFLKGQATTVAPVLTTPTGYELVAGQTVPKTYTLANYSKTNPVVKIHVRKDITVSFQGQGTQTYNGQPASVTADTLGNAVTGADTDTGHNLDVSGLTAEDFDWYQGTTKLDGAPTAVGDYTIKLNDAGLTALKNKNKNYVLSLGTTNSYAYHITAAAATVSFTGSHTKTYDGTAATLPDDADSTSHISANLVNHESLDLSGLSAGDFDWYQGSTKLDSAPTAVGDYTIKLNADGLTALKNKNKNYALALDSAQGYAYHINKAAASAALSGSNKMTYSGNAAKTSDINASGGNITVTISIPNSEKKIAYTLQDGDYTWNTSDGSAPIKAGSYTIKLNNANILSHLQDQIAADSTWKGNVDLTDANLGGSADFTINKADANVKFSGQGSKTYDGDAAMIPDDATTASDITATGLQGNDKLDLTGLSTADFDWYDTNGNKLDNAPKAAGTYTIKLNADGLDKLQANKNYTWGDVTGTYTYTINKANPTAVFVGNGSKTYDGSAIDSYTTPIGIAISAPGTVKTIDLTAGTDYVWTKDGQTYTSAPVEAGNYSIELTDAGKTKIENVNAANLDWKDADITGTGTYTINKAPATVKFTDDSGQTVEYTGQSGQFDPSKFVPTISTNNGQTLTVPSDLDLSLADGDFTFTINGTSETTEPTEVGSYTIGLTAQGLAKLEARFSKAKDYDWSNVASATYTINKAGNIKVTISDVNGGQKVDYNDTTYSNNDIVLDNYKVTLANGLTFTLQKGDLEFVPDENPLNVGTYHVELSTQAQNKINSLDTKHYSSYDFSKAIGTFTINKAIPTVKLVGTGSKVYDGKGPQTGDFTDRVDLEVTAPSNPTIDLVSGDYEFVGQDGTHYASPINVGTYTIVLTTQGRNKILNNTDNGTNIDWSKVDLNNIGTGSFTIKAAEGKAVLSGKNSRDYNGVAVSTSDVNSSNGNIIVTISIPNSDKKIAYTLQDGDYTWNTTDGSAPSAAGSYTINLNKDNILSHLQAKIAADATWKGNVDLTDANLDGSATFKITAAAATVTFTGTGSKKYDGKAATLPADVTTDTAIKATGLKNSDQFVLTGLTDNDFDWYDQTGTHKFTAAPTAAGDYTIKLNANGLAKLQANNPNYSFNEIGGTYAYTINKASATAALSGSGERTYNGSTVDNDDIRKQDANNTIALKITIPGVTDPQTITLDVTDFDWSQGSTKLASAPSAAGTYKLVLNDNGKEAIAEKFSSNTNIDWTQTIANGSATYTIKKLASDAVMANAQTGNYKMTYNGAAPSSIDPSKFVFTTSVNGQTVTLDATGLNSSDFTWADGSAPVNVGTYKIVLTDNGLAKLNAKNTNFILTKAGNGTLTINQANASAALSGSASRKYNGQAVTVDEVNNDGTITLTLHYPKDGNADYSKTVKLSSGDFTWNTSNGQAPVDANAQPYSITLNQDAIEKIIEQAVGTGQNGVSNVKFADNAITGTANFTITPLDTDATLANVTEGNYSKVYDAKATNQIDPTKFQITVTVDGKKITLNTQSFTGNSYEWVDASGNVLTENPKNVGTYYVKLTDAAFNSLQAANPNFTLTNTGLGIYTIKQAQATATLKGSNSKVYDGAAISLDQLNSNGDIKIELNFPGVNGQTYVLKQGDYTISGNATDVGKYTISLTDTGVANVENYIESLAGNGQNNQSNVIFATNAISGTANFKITPSANVISVSGTQTETYNGSIINVVYNADGTNSVVVSIAKADNTGALASLTNVTLGSGDFTVVNGPAVNANTYQVQLTNDGLTKIQNALGKNYSISLDTTATGNLVVKKAPASAKFSGQPSFDYTGTSVSPDDYLSQYSIKLNEPNNPTYKLVAGDIEFNVNGAWTTQAPVNVGIYDVRLSQQGWNHIKAINSDNVEWPADASAGEGTYTINRAKATAELSGKNSKIYNGSPVSTADLYTNGSTIKVVINGTGINNLPTTFTLSDGDYTWTTNDGQAPINVGNYTIKLTQAGINRIQSIIDKAVGVGNVGLTTTADNAGSASFEIEQEVASNVQLYGNEQSIYNGHAVNFDPANSQVAKNFGFNNVENLTIPAFDTSDFSWYDEHGKKISAPINAGTYYLRLNSRGEQAFANANTNYTFVDQKGNSTISGQITYVVTPAELTIKVSGDPSKVYDGKNAEITQDQIKNGDIKLVWGDSTSEPVDLGKFTLTPADFKVVGADGHPVFHANFDNDVQTGGTYYVQLTDDAIAKIKQLNGASNYNISQITDSATYIIYTNKAELTIKGNQTTSYGTELPFDESKYTLDFSNWVNTNISKPVLSWQNGELFINGQRAEDNYTYHTGDLYVDGYPDGGVPTDVGIYKVKISAHLTEELHKLFPDYDFSGNVASGSSDKSTDNDPVDASHEPATYVITPAQTTIKINGAQHVKYGESTAITDGQYTASVTAPVDGKDTTVVINVALTSTDLTTVPSDSKVGSYTLKLTGAGLAKIQAAITGHGNVTKNYSWTQAKNASASFFVDQMPVTIGISGQSSVDYGSQDWLKAIKSNPTGYTLTITTENGTKLNYTAADGDLVFAQTPGNVGTYQVELSAQGLANIEKALGTNYAYPQVATDVTAKGTFTVKQGEVTVTLNGHDGKTYNASQTLPSGLNLNKYSLTPSVTVYLADGTAQTLNLTAADLQIVGNATNVGTYQVELSPAGQERLEQLTGNDGANYKWTFESNADYKITAATASAELNGSNQKTFDGSAVTTAEVNSNGQILVHFTFPGSTTQSTYILQDGDYTWKTKDGKAPTKVGTYTINLNKSAILAHLQAALNAQAGNGNVTISTDNLRGYANFKITPKTITNVTVSGDEQSKTYNGHSASLDVSGLKITADGTLADTSLVNPGIKVSDFTWYDADGKQLNDAPTNVGHYQARLKASTLAELQERNPNYQFSSVDGVINYEIKPAPATATIGDSSERNYDAHTTSTQDVMDNVKWTSTGLVTGQSLNHAGLTANSYAWYTKDSEGNYVAMTGNPINAGTYYLRLTDAAIAKIKADNPNYNFTSVNGEYTYTINAVAGKATLSGSASKTYDGHAVTTTEVDSTNGNIIVHFTFPGSTVQSTYTLQDGDYEWLTKNVDGTYTAMHGKPTNAGTYTIKLSKAGLAHLQGKINQYAGQGNVTLDAQNLLGSATYTIKRKKLDVTLGNRTGAVPAKPYDDAAATINPDDANLSAQGLIAGQTLNTTGLTGDDFKWVDENGKQISAPTNVGTYYVALTAHGLQTLQADNPNYEVSESGKFKYVISPAEADVTIKGRQESASTTIDGTHFEIKVPSGVVVPKGMTYEFASGTTPTQSGVYLVGLTPKSLSALQKANPNYKLNISSTAEFTLDATLTIIFQDTDENNKQVGDAISKTGVAESSIDALGLKVPDGYVLVSSQNLPTNYTFGKNLQQSLYIKLVHQTKNVDPLDPSTNPDPQNQNWFKEKGLIEDVTRTISYEGLTDAQLSEIPDSEKKQTVQFTRTAKYDVITHKLVSGSEGDWRAGTSTEFTGFTPHKFAGYTADKVVPDLDVDSDSQNVTVVVTYTADNHNSTITYVDKNGNTVKVDHISGETGETITIKPDVPKGWQIVPGQDIPEKVKVTSDGMKPIKIIVEQKTTPQPPTQPTNPTPDNPPTSPTEPTKPVEPTKPTEPGQKTNGGSTKPSTPGKPAKPTKPGKPNKPNKPAKPGKSGHKPGKPNKPGKQPQHHGSAKPTRRPGYNHNSPTKSQTKRWSSSNRPLYDQMPSISHHYLAVGPENGESQPSETHGQQSAPSVLGNRSDRYDQNGKLLPQTGSHNTSFLTILGLTMTGLAALFGIADRKKKKR